MDDREMAVRRPREFGEEVATVFKNWRLVEFEAEERLSTLRQEKVIAQKWRLIEAFKILSPPRKYQSRRENSHV